MKGSGQNIFAIQVGDAKPEYYDDLDERKAVGLIKERSPHMAERLQTALARVEVVTREIVSDPDKVVEYYRIQSAHAQVDMEVNRALEDTDPGEQRALIESYHRYTAIGSCLLYADPNFRGSTRFHSATWPNFGWWPYRFHDRASSAKAWGGNVLFEHSWYRGRRLWLIGFPYFEAADFSQFGFDNIASSYAGF